MAVTLAVLMICSVLPWGYTQGAGQVLPGASLADISLGTPIAEVVQRLGSPTTVRLVGADGTLAYTFGKYGITVYTRANAVIALTTTNSVLGTARGIGMGAPKEAVAAAFGAARSTGMVEGFPGVVYEAQGIAFGFDRNNVATVMVFTPSASATPTPATPQVSLPMTSQAIPGGRGGASSFSANTPSTAETAQAQAAPGEPVVPGGPAPMAPAAPTFPTVPFPGAVPGWAAPVTPAAPTFPTVPSPGVVPGGPAPMTPAVPTFPAVPSPGVVPFGLPDVSRLRPYTAQTLYLSLGGYLRYLVYAAIRQFAGPVDSQQIIRPAENTMAP